MTSNLSARSCEVSMLLTNFSLVGLAGTIYSLSSLTSWCLLVYDISPWWSFFSSYSFLMIQFSFDFLQYIGSFSVTGADPNERAENVQKQLEQMRVSMIQTCRTVRKLSVLCRDKVIVNHSSAKLLKKVNPGFFFTCHKFCKNGETM